MITSNSLYQVVFHNIGDERNLYAMFHNRKIPKKIFVQIVKDAFQNPYDYIVFDNNPKNPDNCRITIGIFPNESLYVYFY